MQSIFDLPVSPDQLAPSNSGVSRSFYERISPNRTATGTSFSSGVVRFQFGLSGTQRWIPSRSYLRLRMRVSDAADLQVKIADDLALNSNPCANLWSQGEFLINNTTVSQCTNYCAEVDQCYKRLNAGKMWLDNVGNDTSILSPDFKSRQAAIASDDASEVKVGKGALGVLPPGELAWTQITNTVTLTVSVGTDLRRTLNVGDVVYTSIAGIVDQPLTIVTVPTALTFTVSPIVLADVAAAESNLYKYEKPLAKAKNAEYIELCYQPNFLSIFGIDQALPVGQYSLDLTPSQDSVWKKRVIQSLLADKVINTDYKVSIEEIQFYIARVDTARMDSAKYLLDLKEIRLLQDNISANETTNNFNVSPSTNALTFAFADSRRGTDSRISPSEFKIWNDAKTASDLELSLSRFYFQYRGQKFPPVDVQPIFDESESKDYLTSLYMDNSLSASMYENKAMSGESYDDWKKRGMMLHYQTPSDGSSQDTRLTTTTAFRTSGSPTATGASFMRILILAHSSSVAQITIKDSRVQNVVLQSV